MSSSQKSSSIPQFSHESSNENQTFHQRLHLKQRLIWKLEAKIRCNSTPSKILKSLFCLWSLGCLEWCLISGLTWEGLLPLRSSSIRFSILPSKRCNLGGCCLVLVLSTSGYLSPMPKQFQMPRCSTIASWIRSWMHASLIVTWAQQRYQMPHGFTRQKQKQNKVEKSGVFQQQIENSRENRIFLRKYRLGAFFLVKTQYFLIFVLILAVWRIF